MIQLNVKQGLPPRAFWYLALTSLIAAGFIALIAAGIDWLSGLSNMRCSGALCGKVSGHTFAAWLDFAAALVLLRAVLYYKLFSFKLTDRMISITSGVLSQQSCAIPFERIQVVDTVRNPLHLLLGLASVKIWTASPDQRRGNYQRPDGLIVLEAEVAEWLRDYLSNGAATNRGNSPAAGNISSPVVSGNPPRVSVGVLLVFAATAVLFSLGALKFLRPATPPGSLQTAGTAGAAALTAGGTAQAQTAAAATAPKLSSGAIDVPSVVALAKGQSVWTPDKQFTLWLTGIIEVEKGVGDLKQISYVARTATTSSPACPGSTRCTNRPNAWPQRDMAVGDRRRIGAYVVALQSLTPDSASYSIVLASPENFSFNVPADVKLVPGQIAFTGDMGLILHFEPVQSARNGEARIQLFTSIPGYGVSHYLEYGGQFSNQRYQFSLQSYDGETAVISVGLNPLSGEIAQESAAPPAYVSLRSEAMRRLNAHRDQFAQCYRSSHVVARSSLDGALVLDVTIDTKGLAKRIEVKTDTFHSQPLEGCVLDVIGNVSDWPIPPADTVVDYTVPLLASHIRPAASD
jgi:membrane protein YdbS with pleckstrin-like domain